MNTTEHIEVILQVIDEFCISHPRGWNKLLRELGREYGLVSFRPMKKAKKVNKTKKPKNTRRKK